MDDSESASSKNDDGHRTKSAVQLASQTANSVLGETLTSVRPGNLSDIESYQREGDTSSNDGGIIDLNFAPIRLQIIRGDN